MDQDSDHCEEPPVKIKPPDPNGQVQHTQPILLSQIPSPDSALSVPPLSAHAAPVVPPPPMPTSSSRVAPPSSSSSPSLQSISIPKPPQSKRHRCYPESSKGPYEVFVRQKDKPVKVLLVSAEVHKHFRSVKEVKQIGFTKFRIIFSDRLEANNVVYNELPSRLCRVYIPSERVEIDGVINQAEMDLNYLTNEGYGKFKDPRVPQVSILECQQLAEARVEDNVKTYSPSNEIRVTLEGTILPDYVEIDKALIRVRVYTPKVMLCAKCKRFGHTEIYCSNLACKLR
ncbi:AAEL015535-PA [Aedes aegypti]|uniref:AAEL015535-PA n=1 Tax=Aedes aegypti TaxID=7159 RepID=Q1DGQ3_AEDAE|nr:AAEL015535-PA [Aedes aegypti]